MTRQRAKEVTTLHTHQTRKIHTNSGTSVFLSQRTKRHADIESLIFQRQTLGTTVQKHRGQFQRVKWKDQAAS